MDLPQAPKDIGLRNIIDKLAEFVARNGQEFEAMTKSKQKGNPKFGFLYGGEYYNYYTYKVASEQAVLKHSSISQPQQTITSQSSVIPSIPGLLQGFPTAQVWSNPPPVNTTNTGLNVQIETINLQQISLRDQIRQSEQNLQAQHGVLMQQQQSQIDEAIIRAQNELIQIQAEECGIRITELEGLLQPIIDSCTKDSISTGKSWILQHSSDSSKCNVISKYLLKKALVNGALFSQKLHLIYLINDVLHHCVRKNADELKKCLENVVIPMFCSAQLISNDDQQAKLTKLLTLWESKANFFDLCVMSKLRSPTSSLQEYKTNLLSVHAPVVNSITLTTKQAFESYQQQHQAFIQHATQQITLLETQKQSLEQQNLKSILPSGPPPLMPPGTLIEQTLPQVNSINNNNGNLMMTNQHPPPVTSSLSQSSRSINTQITRIEGTNPPPPSLNSQQTINMTQTVTILQQNLSGPPPPQGTNLGFNSNSFQPQQLQQTPHPLSPFSSNNSNVPQSALPTDFSLPPPIFQIPDLSKPPPGFTHVVEVEDLTPSVPYFELPAGLIVPLIRLEDYGYKPLDSTLIKLPPPTPPNERLVSAVEAFYSLPSHDRPRDGEGWEKLGLYEYYKVKNAAKKQKEDEIEKGIRDESRSPSPIIIEIFRPKSNKRRYRSKSRSKSRSRSRSSSKSISPETRRITRKPQQRLIRSPLKRSSSPSPPPKKNSPSYRRDRERGGGGGGGGNRDRDRDRSISPPSFFGGNYAKQPNEHIEESNKGHQMLMKMGWGGTGTGLGVQGQGIDAPIMGGDVRDRQDLYKGVGINLNDPYENFRKNKGAAFITRMKARAEERS